ncbi:sensor histidine kinase [Nibrella saemangeumensis]
MTRTARLKRYLTNPDTVQKAEFWGATLLYAIFILAYVIFADPEDTPKAEFERANVPFSYYENYYIPSFIRYSIIYVAFLLLNFRIIPRLVRKEKVWQMILLAALIFLIAGLARAISDSDLNAYLVPVYETREAYNDFIFTNGFFVALLLFVIVGIYATFKYTVLYLATPAEGVKSKKRTVIKDTLGAFGLWIISMILLLMAEAEGEVLLGWSVILLTAIPVYALSFFRLIPNALGRSRPFLAYLLRTVLVLVIINLFLFVLLTPMTGNAEIAINYVLFNTMFQLVITVPLSWILYKRYQKGSEEVLGLQQELGQSEANVDFLRSQINPHFLFNALNTIYGTALQENAERTSEAVEKLADMMRFMLHENMQHKIPLTREIEYLTNYISLQKLRTDPNLTIHVQIDAGSSANTVQIAPMLLIPFVENAFKHGISLREPSHIMVSLDVKDGTLNFDVHNSRHVKPVNDPEKDKSGIGLSNVKQRLELLYPNRHELLIRETGNAFFIHLTIQLT